MEHGNVETPFGRSKVFWLDERPARFGGAWALGCVFCAWACQNAPAAHVKRGSKFASYEVRSATLQSKSIFQHSVSDDHRRAQAAYLQPDVPVSISLQASWADDMLLMGKVPQPEDWLRVWRRCMESRSWRSAERDAKTEDYMAPIARGGWHRAEVTRKSMKAMMHMMVSSHRDRKREWLREAKVIFWSFDDKGGRKLLMFKCDTPTGTNDCKLSTDPTWIPYGARIGIAGCVPIGRGDKSDYERDYAERAAAEIMKMIGRLCTQRPGSCVDAGLKEHVLDVSGGIVVDGALLKTARVLKEQWMKHIRIIVRDPCHIIRPSCKDPLEDAEKFREQHDRLFGARHALLKDIQNSVQWQSQLEACERHVVAEGSAAEDVRTLLKHFGFVEPRWESFVSPRRRYVCLLRAIAHLLVLKAGDERLKGKIRARAQAALDAMTPADCFIAGVAGDYGEVCLEFLRVFDVTDLDPARLEPEMSDFKRALHTFFVDGYVLCDPNPACVDAAAKKSIADSTGGRLASVGSDALGGGY